MITYEEFLLKFEGEKRFDRVSVECSVDGCHHISYVLKYSAIQNFKRNGRFICMSCAHNDGWTCVLNDDEKDIILGSLLGDTSALRGPTKNNRTTLFQFEHSTKQSSYLMWKYDNLKRLAAGVPKERINHGYGDKNIRFNTRCHSCFNPIYDMTIKNGIKIVNSEWLNSIKSPLSLAVWYMDDGSLDKNGQCSISTDGFTKQEVELICEWLKDKWDVDGSPRLHCGKYFQTRLKSVGRDKLFDLISSYIIPSLKYKIGETDGPDC